MQPTSSKSEAKILNFTDVWVRGAAYILHDLQENNLRKMCLFQKEDSKRCLF